jgi:hypothetical protein
MSFVLGMYNVILQGDSERARQKAWVLYTKYFEQTRSPTKGSQLGKFKKLAAVWK